jgi:hypothetical protein
MISLSQRFQSHLLSRSYLASRFCWASATFAVGVSAGRAINEGVARHQNAQRLLALARELQSYPGATLADCLLLLDMLHQLEDPEFRALAKHPEKQREAFQTLYRYYTKTGDSQGLYRVLVRLSELDSGNLDVQNNLAQISLLLTS